MSQYNYDPMAGPVRETNGLGIAGFICSLLGLFTVGLLCPIGLLLSLIALGRRPKGFAIAGVILGLLGSCLGLLVLLLFGGAAILAFLGLAAFILTQSEKFEITADMVMTTAMVQKYEQQNGELPANLDLVDIDKSNRLDPWGNEYDYRLIDEEPGFDLVSAGMDGLFDTEDDVLLSRLDEAWETAFEDFEKEMKDLESRGGKTIYIGDDDADEETLEADEPPDVDGEGEPESTDR